MEGEKTKLRSPKLIAIIVASVVALAAVTVATVALLGGGSNDQWLRKALAEDSVRTIELTEDIHTIDGYEVNGTKTLVGGGTIYMDATESYVLSVNSGASLTVDGVSINVKNIGANGIIVRDKGTLVWKDGSLTYPKEYAIMNYGNTTIEGGKFDMAGKTWLYVKSGTTAKVTGGHFNKSNDSGFVVETDATLQVSGDPLMEQAGSSTIENNGKLVMTGGTIRKSNLWTIANHGQCQMSNVNISECALKGALYNYADATAVVEDCVFNKCTTYQIYNVGTATVRRTVLESSEASTVNNGKASGIITLEDCKILNSNYHAFYNEQGTMTIKNCLVDGTVYKAVQNKAGNVTIDGLTVENCAGSAIGNVALSEGEYGTITANNLTITGTKEYNVVSYGGEVTLSNSVLNPSEGTNVYIRDGKGTLENMVIHGTATAGKASLAVGSSSYRGANVTVKGADTLITGGSRGITNYGTLSLYDGLITDNSTSGEQAMGGGVYTQGVFYMYGGRISGNAATTQGGGVRIGQSGDHYGEMYMYGGTISGNWAGQNGGGVSIGVPGCVFEMVGGTVSGNRANAKGDGVMVNGTFLLHDGTTISDNDVFLYDKEQFIQLKGSTYSGAVEIKSTSFATDGIVAVKCADAVPADMAAKFTSANDQWTLEAADGALVTKMNLQDLKAETDFSDATLVQVSTFAELERAVESTSGKKVIQITADIPMAGRITVPYGASVKITDDGTARTLKRSDYGGVLFNVEKRSELYLAGNAGLTVDGDYASGYVAYAPLVKSTYEGMVVLQAGATLQNAMNSTQSTDSRAGAVNLYGGRMVMAGGNIVNCDASAQLEDGTYENEAGVYVATSSILSIQDGVISGCDNGAIRSYGRVYMSGGTIKDNQRIGDGGAALRCPVLIMSGGTIEGNTSSNAGSAVYLTKSDSTPEGLFLMTGGTIKDNQTGVTGGTIKTGGAVYVGADCTFRMEGGTLSGNKAGVEGNYQSAGAIQNSGITYLGKDAVIENNYATNSAGAIYNNGTMTIEGAVIRGNTTDGLTPEYGKGGAVYNLNKGVLVAKDALFEGNISAASGGAVNNTGKATFENCTFRSNDALNTAAGNASGEKVYGSAGAILSTADLTVVGGLFEGNHCVTKAAAVFNDDGTVTMTDTVLKNNACDGSVGAICNSKGTMTLTNVTLTGNVSGNNGGAIMNQGEGVLTVSGGAMNTNSAKSKGGALYIDSGKVTVTGTAFEGNTAASAGAIVNAASAEAVLEKCSFNGNTVTANGGAVMNQGSSVLTVKDSSFTANEATKAGGAFYNDKATATFVGVTMSGNKAGTTGADIQVSKNSLGMTLGGATEAEDIYLADGKTLALNTDLTADKAIGLTGENFAHGVKVLDGATADNIKLFALPDGFRLVSDGTLEAYVAQVGEVSYFTLADAIAAANGAPVILLADYAGDITVAQGETLSIDADGKTLTGAVTVDGTLNLTDATATGAVTVNGTLAVSGLVNASNVTVNTANNGTIQVETALDSASSITVKLDSETVGATVLSGAAKAESYNQFTLESDYNRIAENGAVAEITAVVKNTATNKEYKKLAEAVAEATEGDTLELVFTAPVTELTVDKNLTISATSGEAFTVKGKLIVAAGKTLTLTDGATVADLELADTAKLNVTDTWTGSVTKLTVSETACAGNVVVLEGAVLANYEKIALANQGYMLYADGTVVPAGVAKIGDKTYATLAEAVAEAVSGDTITLIADVRLGEDQLTLEKNLTIKTDGKKDRTITSAQAGGNYVIKVAGTSDARVTVDIIGTENSRLIIDGENVGRKRALLGYEYADGTVEYVSFRNGKCIESYGGGGYLTNATVTMKYCEFTNNTTSDATYGGGALMSSSTAVMTLENCTFKNNTAVVGGAVYVNGKGTMSGCTFERNTATITKSSGGGAVYVSGSGELEIGDGCLFNENKSKYCGGAVFAAKKAKLTVKKATFYANNATHRGGAMYTEATAVLSMDGATFTENAATDAGGAFFSAWASASSTDGGSNQEMTNVTFIDNTAGYFGGAVGFSNNSSGLTLKGTCTFTNNTSNSAKSYGGGAVLVGKELVIDGNVTMTDNTSSWNGGAICLQKKGPLTVVEGYTLTLSGNTSDKSGNDVYLPTSSTQNYNADSYGNIVDGAGKKPGEEGCTLSIKVG